MPGGRGQQAQYSCLRLPSPLPPLDSLRSWTWYTDVVYNDPKATHFQGLMELVQPRLLRLDQLLLPPLPQHSLLVVQPAASRRLGQACHAGLAWGAG